jgi:hypothetical protein
LNNAAAINHEYFSDRSEQGAPVDEASLSNHVEVLKELAQALIREIDRLRSTQLPDVEHGISFYEEVERFEVNLIQDRAGRAPGLRAPHSLSFRR